MARRTHVIYLVTHPITARYFLRGQLGHLREAGLRVTLVTSPGPDLDLVAEREGVEVIAVPMEREMSPLRDLVALARIVRLFLRLRPDGVVAGTPKAGLLGMVAARAARIPRRIYQLRGLRLETATGWKRWVLKATERTAAACAHRVLCVSHSLKERVLVLGLAPAAKLGVPGAGSSNGVDVDHFARSPRRLRRAEELRRELELPAGDPVVGFVGRFTRDKGLPDLLEAFERLRRGIPEARLLLLGAPEPGDPVPAETLHRLTEDPRIHLPGFVADPADYYPLMDVLAFPSHREGLPNVPLEAAAAELPTVGYDATGTRDAVSQGVTGTLVPVGDVEGLATTLNRYLRDDDLRQRQGRAARRRVKDLFDRHTVWRAWSEELLAPVEPGETPRPRRYPRWLARGLDLTGLALALPVVLPLGVLVALLVRLFLGSPVWFRQTRPGLHGEPFTLLKFRTMTDARDEEGNLLPDEDRLTRFGRFLRTTSLDELPELVNVWRGDMRWVGPRPLLMRYLDRYTPEQARRHDVKPGLTGWAQIHGRNAVDWDERFRLDVWYVDHRSLWLDLKILMKTPRSVLSGRGIHAPGHETMYEFRGEKEP